MGLFGLFGLKPAGQSMDAVIAKNPRQPDLIYIGGRGSAVEWPGLTIYFDARQHLTKTAIGIPPTLDQLKAQLK